MKQTAVQQLEEYLTISLGKDRMRMLANEFEKAKAMEKGQIILLVERIMEYTKESHSILGHDEREASEFVDIFYKENFKSE